MMWIKKVRALAAHLRAHQLVVAVDVERAVPVAKVDLEQLLKDQRDVIVKRWMTLVFEAFPTESQPLLKKTKKQAYLNPMGHTLANAVESLYDELLGGTSAEKVAPILDEVIKATSLQDGLPSKALNFLFVFKKALRAQLAEDKVLESCRDQLDQVENLIDQVVRMAIDILVKNRETIYQLKVDEMERKTFSLIKLVNAQAINETS